MNRLAGAGASDAAGQHRTSGNALIGMGALGLAVALIVLCLRLELRFIDGWTMGLFGAVLAGVGVWQRSIAATHEVVRLDAAGR